MSPSRRRACIDHARRLFSVGLALSACDAGADLLIVNKFGKREAAGRGFVAAINHALERDIAVLVAVSTDNLAAWHAYADPLDTPLRLDLEMVLSWFRKAIAAR